MAYVAEDVKPHVWTEKQAYSSGRTAYRIGVNVGDNPFKDTLSKCWLQGYNDAAASDTFSKRRVDYLAEERPERHDKRQRFTDTSKPGHTPGRPQFKRPIPKGRNRPANRNTSR